MFRFFVEITTALLSLGFIACSQNPKNTDLNQTCSSEKTCRVFLPQSRCADGSTSYVDVTRRENAERLLIFVSGGGACWDEQSCRAGAASNLSSPEETIDWESGSGIRDRSNPDNPFAEGYSIAYIPYCTGDFHAGQKLANYSLNGDVAINHNGFNNLIQALDAIAKEFSESKQAVFYGCSAGGIGVYYNMAHFVTKFASMERYVISDGGAPFSRESIGDDVVRMAHAIWGLENTLPDGAPKNADLSDLVLFNAREFQNTKFALVSSLDDSVMNTYAKALGSVSQNPTRSSLESLIVDLDNLSDTNFNHKLFVSDGDHHCHYQSGLSVSIDQMTLSQWIKAMLTKSSSWDHRISEDFRE